MDKTISLTIAERYDVIKYAHQIPSSRLSYFSFPAFLDVIQITPEEEKEYDIKVVGNKIECNCPDKKFEYKVSDFPEIIINTIKHYVEDVKGLIEEEKKNTPDHSASPFYTNAVNALSKVLV